MQRRSFLRLISMSPVFAIAFAREARATLYVALPDDALLARADVVTLARVNGSAPEWSNGRIVSRIRLAADETYKGVHASSLEVIAPGGTIDGIGMRVAGYPTFEPGSRAVLLLARVGNAHRLVGAAAGKLDVVRDARGVDMVRTPASSSRGSALVALEDVRRTLHEAIDRIARRAR